MDTPTAPAAPVLRLAYSIDESTVATGLSRTSIYRLIKRGELRTVQIGQRRLIPRAELERLCQPNAEPPR